MKSIFCCVFLLLFSVPALAAPVPQDRTGSAVAAQRSGLESKPGTTFPGAAMPAIASARQDGGSSGIPEVGWPPAVGEIKPPEIDYISPKTVPLNDMEKKALGLSTDWSRRNLEPVLAEGGKVVFVHGASMPTVIAAPMQVCDVELQAGETVHEIVVGDSARWLVVSGSAGSGSASAVHLFIKPVDAGLESSAVVTTDRRVYHLRLVSQRTGHTPYVGFLYADDLRQQAAQKRAKDARDKEWASTSLDGKAVDLSSLNFNYEVKGKASWKPERVYDDGQQMFIRLPGKSKSGEMPVLLVRKGKQDVLVNYRVKDQAMVVDGLFERIALVIGVGGDQEKVEIIREGK